MTNKYKIIWRDGDDIDKELRFYTRDPAEHHWLYIATVRMNAVDADKFLRWFQLVGGEVLKSKMKAT